MAFGSKIERPTQNFSKVARPTSGGTGRFGIGRFGVARFGQGDSWQTNKVARPTQNFSKVARP